MQDLIDVLVQTNKQKSFEVAKNLKQLKQDAKTYDFAIRKANLDIVDAKNIAKAIKKIDLNDGPKIGRAHVRTPVTEKSRMPSSA